MPLRREKGLFLSTANNRGLMLDPRILYLIHLLRKLYILRDGKAGDIRDDRLMEEFRELRKLVLYDISKPRILQPDGIEHTGGALRDQGDDAEAPLRK